MALTTAIVVGTVATSAYSANQAKKGAQAQARSYDAATAEQARQFDVIQEQQQPWMEAGKNALAELTALSGIGGQPANFENFFASPDYQFALQQGMQGVQNSAAARGGLYSGNALRAITDYGQGMASQQLGNYANRLAGIAGVGQTATNQLTGASQNYANNVGNLLVGQGNARASGIVGQGNAWVNGANQLAMLYGMGAFGGGGGGAGIHAGNWGYGVPGYGSMV